MNDSAVSARTKRDQAVAAAEAALAEGRARESLVALRQALIRSPGDAAATELLARALETLGQSEPGSKAAAMAGALELHHPALQSAAAEIEAGRLPQAERLLRDFLALSPDDPSALRLLAQLASQAEHSRDGELLLRRALALAPDFASARFDLAGLLYEQNALDEALELLAPLLRRDPTSVKYRMLQAAAFSRLGRTDEALAVYEAVLGDAPGEAEIWTLYGHALRTRGRQADCIAAYRRAIAIDPANGLAWFALANLKTVRLDSADAAAIEAALARGDLREEDRVHLHFALGKAAEDAGEAEKSFEHYAAGNRLVRQRSNYDAGDTTDLVARSEALFATGFFAARAGWGAPSAEPIFVLGMPRSGSTLVEQILGSHQQIEGTAELPYIPRLAEEAGAAARIPYPQCLAALDAAAVRALGEDYLARAAAHRRQGRPLFIDKNPPNWLHIGLIRTILPNARIVDVRRHPLDCGFSNFKQHFAHGDIFAYALEDIGRYYRDYVRLLRHFDAVLPGAVHRVVYERLIEDPQREVRTLLAFLGLDFDQACLRFWETERVVRTYSSEQVRRPINRDGIDQWRIYEPWLEPLKRALGPNILEDHY